MKRFFLYFILTFLVVLLIITIGCAQKAMEEPIVEEQETLGEAEEISKEEVEPPAEETEEQAEISEETEDVESEIVETETENEMSSELQELLAKARKQRSNFEYYYDDPARKSLEYQYKIYKNQQLVRLPYPFEDDEMKFGYVLFNTDNKTAEGYCTHIEPYQCRYGEGPFDLDYEEWHRPSIQDWIMDIEYAEIISDGFVSSRLTKVIEFERGNDTYRMNLDKFYGIPLKIEINPESDDPVVHNFKEVQVSVLDKTDVLPPLQRNR
ncbi:hypothetical protein ACFL96_18585 [Thermoproteota archaeon]